MIGHALEIGTRLSANNGMPKVVEPKVLHQVAKDEMDKAIKDGCPDPSRAPEIAARIGGRSAEEQRVLELLEAMDHPDVCANFTSQPVDDVVDN